MIIIIKKKSTISSKLRGLSKFETSDHDHTVTDDRCVQIELWVIILKVFFFCLFYIFSCISVKCGEQKNYYFLVEF